MTGSYSPFQPAARPGSKPPSKPAYRVLGPRRSRALAALCQQLNDTETVYPGTNLVLHYAIKDIPNVA